MSSRRKKIFFQNKKKDEKNRVDPWTPTFLCCVFWIVFLFDLFFLYWFFFNVEKYLDKNYDGRNNFIFEKKLKFLHALKMRNDDFFQC